MNCDRLFLDTAFIQALLNPRDDYHTIAKVLFSKVRNAKEVWTTEAILTEVGNALSASTRNEAVRFINQCYQTDNIRVVTINTVLFRQALSLYNSRPDKNWGLTDCISSIVMTMNGITDAVTADRHFIQAGFRALIDIKGNSDCSITPNKLLNYTIYLFTFLPFTTPFISFLL